MDMDLYLNKFEKSFTKDASLVFFLIRPSGSGEEDENKKSL